jgi:hypothetical protein
VTAPTSKLPGARRNHGAGHSYTIDGEWKPSITGVLRAKAIDNIYWPARYAANYAVDYWDELAELKPTQRRDRIEAAAREYTSARGVLGKRVHGIIEKLIAGDEADVPEDLQGYVDAWDTFDRDWQPKPLRIEEPVYNRTAGYAGTPDLVADLADERRWLLDWKTGLKGLFSEIALQLAAARFAEFTVGPDGQELPVLAVDACAGIEIRGDGTYDLRPIEADAEAFAAFLHLKHVLVGFARTDRDRWIGDALLPPSNGGAP